MKRDELAVALSKTGLLGEELQRLGFDPIELEKCVLSEVNQESMDLEQVLRCQCLFCAAMRLVVVSRGGEIFGSDVPENLRNGLSRAKGYFGSVRRLS